jgi:hypothetical protein
MEKDFDAWNNLKQQLDKTERDIFAIQSSSQLLENNYVNSLLHNFCLEL